MGVEELEHALNRPAGQGGVALRPAHQAHEHGAIVHHEGRHAEHLPLGHRLLVGAPHFLDAWSARPASATTLSPGTPARVEHAGHDLGHPEVEPLVVTRGEEGDVRVEESVGVLVADHDAGGERQEVLRLGGVVPHGRSALGDVDLAQREGQERHVPVGTVGQGHGEMLMGVAGEGAAVVPGDGEGLHSSCNTTLGPRPFPRHPRADACRLRRPRLPGVTTSTMGRRPSPRTEPMTAPPITSVGWWARKWTRLAATADAKPTLAAVPASESPRTNAVQKAASVWPLGKLLLVGVRTAAARCSSGRCRSTAALTIRLTRSDEKPADAERHDGAPPVRPAAARLEAGQQHPDEAVVGQVGDDGGRAIDRRASPQRLEGGVDRLVEGAHVGPVTRRRRGRKP